MGRTKKHAILSWRPVRGRILVEGADRGVYVRRWMGRGPPGYKPEREDGNNRRWPHLRDEPRTHDPSEDWSDGRRTAVAVATESASRRRWETNVISNDN
jgi:hypothetical protein